jgi:outer membrane protein assembly factor BamB
MSEQPAPPKGRRPIRWWPALGILLVAAIVYAVLCFTPYNSHQSLNIHFAQLLFWTFASLLGWAILFSRMRWQVRCSILGLTVGVLVLMPAMFRIHGVSGNLVPILEPRWVHHEFQTPAAVAPVATIKAPPGAADFPQFLGPTRDGHLAGPNLATNWTAQPPAELWRVTVGPGWSGFAVAGAVAITQEQRGEDECVIAYDLQTGKVVWSHADKTRYFTTLAGEGPRATPTIAGQRVLTQGATGVLNCLNLADGRVLWSTNIFAANGGSAPTWGEAISPLVHDDLVMASGGGRKESSLVAYHLADGSFAWAGGVKNELGYSSPLAANLAGTNQILLFADFLMSCNPATGKVLWEFPWPGGQPHIAMPVIASSNEVVISSGYGIGSARVRIECNTNGHWTAKQVWRTNRMKAKFTDVILYRGYIYGLDDGIMECIDAATGALAWKEGRYGHGQILLVGDVLLVMAEDGEVILLDPQPDQLRELTRITALHEKTWNPPTLAGEYLLVRNDKEAACFRLPVRN